MLVETVNEYAFRDEMIKHGFSYEGATALFEYYEDFEEDIPFDPIAIRCDFDEYESLEDIKKSYQNIETLEDLQNNTTVIEIPNSDRLIIQAY
jgi:uncharacterized protein Smg (DUF494 family)